MCRSFFAFMSDQGKNESPSAREIHTILASSEFRRLTSSKSKVLLLHFGHGVRQADICRALSLQKGTVSKWCRSPKAPEGAGRPGYLSHEAANHLFGVLVEQHSTLFLNLDILEYQKMTTLDSGVGKKSNHLQFTSDEPAVEAGAFITLRTTGTYHFQRRVVSCIIF